MTTNEDTTALIAEAREHWVELNGLNSRAAEVLLQIADALEAATREQDSAGDIRRAVHLWSERFIPGDRWDTEDARDLDAALKCVVEANPDRSRARVPVQEEPNDDREALSVAIGGVLFNVMNFPAAAQSRLLGQDMRPLRYTLEDAVLEAGFFRTTVSDAATAAVERVRALHRPTMPGYGPKACVHDGRAWPCPTVAALDGAPEPEDVWEYRGRLQSCGYVSEGYISAEHAMNGLRVELEDHPYLVMDNTAIVERARVREWLPVEGEKQ